MAKRLEDEIKQKKFSSEAEKVLVNIIYTYNHFQYNLEKIFKEFKITSQQYNVLRILKGQYPKGITLIEIKNRMLDKNSDVSRIVERMRQKKLLTRKINPKNRREVEICLTQKGLDLLEEIQPHLIKFHSSINHMNNQELQTINELLDKLRNN
jgi:DNA-binding MarR family transcriptional regulator